MKLVKTENIKPFDVDGTLILSRHEDYPGNRKVSVFDPLTETFIEYIVHEPMVRLLKEEKHRGAYVIVWSRGGYEWAHNVVQALGLEDCVDLVLSKPIVYFDDTPVVDWMKDRVFLDPNCNYKK